jgi:hypothetical protein
VPERLARALLEVKVPAREAARVAVRTDKVGVAGIVTTQAQ